MEIYLGGRAPHFERGCALSIGNFDGVHIGHVHMLRHLAQQAQNRGLPAVVMVFEPQPLEFFARESGSVLPFRLSPLRDKLRLLANTGCLDAVWVQRFGAPCAQQTAERFIDEVLRGRLGTRYMLVGDDFRFGRARKGDVNALRAQVDLEVETLPTVLVDGVRASSTQVRMALEQGDLLQAQRVLGHEYTLTGRVKHGQKLARTLGFPTINVHIPALHYAVKGVFVVVVTGAFGRCFGVANLGTNPTVTRDLSPKLEVHLLDFDGDVYAQRVQVSFLHRLRDELTLANIASLKAHIQQDIHAARQWLDAQHGK